MKHQNHSPQRETLVLGEKSENRELIYERHGKYYFKSNKPDVVRLEFKSNGSSEEKKNLKTVTLDKIRNEISSYLFEYLDGFHIPTHFLLKLSDTEMMVKRTEAIQLSLKIYNTINGTLFKRLGMKENIQIELPIIEHYLSNGNRNGLWINEHHVYALSIATPEEFKQMNRIATKTNAVLRGLCDRRQLLLADVQLEFGRYKGQIILADELSPVTCHILDLTVENKAKRDKFTLDKDDTDEAITELSNRLLSRG